jgi:hypothetical protein
MARTGRLGRIEQTFFNYDADGSGRLSAVEFHDAMGTFKEKR